MGSGYEALGRLDAMIMGAGGSGRVSTMTGGSANRLRAITIRPSPSFARGPLTKPCYYDSRNRP